MPFLPLIALALLLLPRPATARDAPFALHVLHKGDNGIFAAGDLDGDGRRDLVIARKPEALRYVSWPSREARIVARGGNVWMEIHAADVDGDGDLDVLGPEMSAGEVLWWENPLRGGGGREDGWKTHHIGSWGIGFPHDFKVGDIDGDGRLDAVLRPKAGAAFRVFLQQAPDAWTSFPVPASGPGEGTALGDIDGDGDLDLTDGLAWWEAPEEPAAQPWARHAFNADYGAFLTRVLVADMDRDGAADILVAPSDTSLALPVLWFGSRTPRTGPWSRRVVLPAGRAPWLHVLQAGDLDGDGSLDVLTGSDHRGSRELLALLSRDAGKGEAWEPLPVRTEFGAWQSVLADVDGDGALDILSADDANDAQQEVWLNRIPRAASLRLIGDGRPSPAPPPEPLPGLFPWGDRGYRADGRSDAGRGAGKAPI